MNIDIGLFDVKTDENVKLKEREKEREEANERAREQEREREKKREKECSPIKKASIVADIKIKSSYRCLFETH